MDIWIILTIVCASWSVGLSIGAAVGFYAAVREGVAAPRYRRASR